MNLKKWIISIGMLLSILSVPGYAEIGRDGLGQTIQIYTHFKSLNGQEPTLLIIIRDLDHHQNIPYVFDITQSDNFWLIFTYGQHYLITASTLKSSKFSERWDDYTEYQVNNFCHLESLGRIIHGESLYVMIDGDLSKNPNSVSCHISRYADSNFSVATPSTSQ